MAKNKNGNGNGGGNGEQLELFPHNPEIKTLGITKFKLDGAVIIGEMQAVTEANDVAMLTPERWADAGAAWIVKLCGGDLHQIQAKVDKAYEEFWAEIRAREKDEAIGYARTTVELKPGTEPDEIGKSNEEIQDSLAKIGMQVPAVTISGWSTGEIVSVKEWIEAALAAKESGEECRVSSPEFIRLLDEQKNIDGKASNITQATGNEIQAGKAEGKSEQAPMKEAA